MTQTINGSEVEVAVIAEDGMLLNEGLDGRELEAVQVLDQNLQSSEKFKAQYPEAKLVHVESMRGLSETELGRFYLRYQQGDRIEEFWGHVGEQAHLNFKTGNLTAVLPKPSGPESNQA